jgi:hypothetical protein
MLKRRASRRRCDLGEAVEVACRVDDIRSALAACPMVPCSATATK